MKLSTIVEQLIDELETECHARGLTLSRWQANGGNYATTISYAAHTGERASQYRRLPQDTIRAEAVLSQSEGATERCEAYRKLSKMLEIIRH